MSSSPPEYFSLTNVRFDDPSESADVLNRIRHQFPVNDLTENQWNVLECVADRTREVPISSIVTYRLCERVEHCSVNEVFLLVTRYLQICPARRQIVPLKTVKVLSELYPLEMYLKHYSGVLKIL